MHGGMGGGGMHFGGMGGRASFAAIGPGPGFRGSGVGGPGFRGPGFAGGPRFVGGPGFAGARFGHGAFGPRFAHFHHPFFHNRFRRFAFVGFPYYYSDYGYDVCWRRAWTAYGLQWINVCGDYGGGY
jgi:hypothetical protein